MDTDRDHGDVVVDAVEDDGLTDDERKELLRMIDESLADQRSGEVESFAEVIARLRSQPVDAPPMSDE